MKLMSRTASPILALLLAFSFVLSACQPVQTPAPVDHPQPQASPSPILSTPIFTSTPAAPLPTVLPLALQVKPEALKGIQIHFWHGWSGETARQVQEIVAEFNRDNVWGIKVVVDEVGGPAVLFDRVNAALAAKDPPALVAAPLDYLVNWHGQQALVDLNLYINSADWGLSAAESDDFLPAFWQETALNGARLGIPAERTTQVLFYNQTWARELGFTQPPTTPNAFQQQACAAAQSLVHDEDKKNDGMGGWVIDRDAMTLLSWMDGFQADLPTAGASDFHFNTSQAASAFSYLRQLFDDSCAWLSRLDQPYQYFASRQALFYSGDLSEIPVQQKMSAHLGSHDQWTVLPFPSQSGQPVLVSSGSSYAILDRKPPDQLAAWLLLRWMILPRNQARLVKAGFSLPVGQQVRAELSAFERSNRSWAGIVDQIDALAPAPGMANWWLARNILEDAGWQMLQPTAQPPAVVLKQLDSTLADVLQHQTQP